jgi:hypothetical protein
MVRMIKLTLGKLPGERDLLAEKPADMKRKKAVLGHDENT